MPRVFESFERQGRGQDKPRGYEKLNLDFKR